MKNKIWKTGMIVTLSSMIILAMGITVFAASDGEYKKNEMVYAAFDQEGKDADAYVVNIFNVTKEGNITDYGDYDKVTNLTNLEKIESDKDEHSFYADEGKFYYQGDLSDVELPWLIDINYSLDGDEVTPEELAGQSGDLEIKIQVKKNSQIEHSEYQDNYMLQILVPMDTEIFDKVICEGGSITDVGKNEQATFAVTPGSEGSFKIMAEVENFELDCITMNGIQQIYERQKEDGSGEIETVKIPSFTSNENKTVNQVMFMMSTEAITILEPKAQVIEEKKENTLQTLKNKLVSLFE